MSNTVVTEEMISAVAWSPSHQEGVPWGMLLNDEQIGNILNIGLANAPAALQSAADTPVPPYAHAASTQTVKSLCELHDKLLRALDEKVGFKMFWANEMSDMASLILDAATELDKAFRQAPPPQPTEAPLPPSKVREE
jgi:hypothetical protein